MLDTIRSFFSKKPPEPPLHIKDLKLGDLVELKYVHPKSIGIVDGQNLTCTRLNHDEVENRVIQGVVTLVRRNEDLRKWYVSIKVYKTIEHAIVERVFLFLEDEIEYVRRVK